MNAQFDKITGELTLPPRWTDCMICGERTPQPPVCGDLRCEIELERGTE
jgi:hypothetical protein